MLLQWFAVVDVPMRISALVGIRFRELKFRSSRTPVCPRYVRCVLDFVDRRRHEESVFIANPDSGCTIMQ